MKNCLYSIVLGIKYNCFALSHRSDKWAWDWTGYTSKNRIHSKLILEEPVGHGKKATKSMFSVVSAFLTSNSSCPGYKGQGPWSSPQSHSSLLALCSRNSLVTGQFTSRPVTQSFDVFFDLPLNKRLSKQSWGWWFEMPSCSLWHHCSEWNTSQKSGKWFLLNYWNWHTDGWSNRQILVTTKTQAIKKNKNIFLFCFVFDCIFSIRLFKEKAFPYLIKLLPHAMNCEGFEYNRISHC